MTRVLPGAHVAQHDPAKPAAIHLVAGQLFPGDHELRVAPHRRASDRDHMNEAPVIFVAMPWCSLFNPSIQLGILKRVAEGAGYRAEQRHYNLTFVDVLSASATDEKPSFTVRDYMEIGVDLFASGLGDWIFAIPAFRPEAPVTDETYLASLKGRGIAPSVLAQAAWVRTRVPAFLDACVADLLAANPRAIGFTTGFSQTIASLALSKLIKARSPATKIIFGGADCDGPLGEGLIRAFPWIDVVVRGEAEPVLPLLLDDLYEDRVVTPQPGVCFRHDGEVTAVPTATGGQVAMDEVPVPDYEEFFARLERSKVRGQILPALELTVESSRGCWWGQKHQCTFCGFNGSQIAFRGKSPERVVSELVSMARAYKTLGFLMTDAIIDHQFFHSVLPRLAESGVDFRIFYEVKANLTRAQVGALRAAGVVHLQPGIESLSTPILAQMRKGTTAFQNIRLLKYCREFGINTLWNIIYGFPGEDEGAYGEMAQLARTLTHLQPPSFVPLLLDRFSPYQLYPDSFGLEILGPPAYYRAVFPDNPEIQAELMNIAYRFEYRHLDGREPERYVGELRAVIEGWRQRHRPEKVTLRYLRGPNFLVIIDERHDLPRGRYYLDGWQADAYLACDAGTTAEKITRELLDSSAPAPSLTEVQSFLQDIAERKLLYREGDRYLSLAIPARRHVPASVYEA